MSVVDWIKSLFGITPRRDVSRLSQDGSSSDLDVIDERIDTSGGPLKEHHRRRALRDRRLLPKVKSPARRLGLTKRKNVMSVVEAERLFGATMRTRNRNLRDLLTDEEQLERYGLPLWKTEEDVALALGLSLKELCTSPSTVNVNGSHTTLRLRYENVQVENASSWRRNAG